MSDAYERLETYRAKRDFTVTAEPAGTGNPPAGSSRFVVQRHRARRLHYDLRLEMAGVLVSWAVPRGPTLDPKARQLAVHVEDHPVEYFDFEGVIPKGEYGGGDVIVWDWGTWSHAKPGDPLKAIEKGDLHFDLDGQKLRGRFVLVRRDRDSSGKEQWLLLHKNDDFAVPGWDPEEHLRSVKTGLTNDQVKAAPEALWRSDLPAAEASVAIGSTARPAWDPPSAEELAALDALGKGGVWQLQGRELKVTNLDKVLFPAGADGRPVTKREVIRYYAQVAPWMLPYLYDRPLNLYRSPNGVDKPGFWHKEVPSHAPDWLQQWHNTEADPGETTCYAVVDSVPALAWMANYGGLELHAWTSRIPEVHKPTWALIDIDPGTTTGLRRHPGAGPPVPDRPGAPRRGRHAQGDGQARRADLDPHHAGVQLRRHPGVGGEGVPGGGPHRPGAGQLGVAQDPPRGPGPARLHPERHQQDAGGAVQPPPRRRGARLGAHPLGRARRPRICVLTGGRSVRCSTAWPAPATRWRP